jgi:hypothetical protein
MPCFTQELSCTDGSTDTSIFRPSVHPTLHRSVGPTSHIRRRPPYSFLTLICRPPLAALDAAFPLASGDHLASRVPRASSTGPSVPAAGRRASPPRQIARRRRRRT